MDRELDERQDGEAIRLRTSPPRTRRLNKKSLTLAAMIVGLAVAAALYWSLLRSANDSHETAPAPIVIGHDLGTLSDLGPRRVPQPVALAPAPVAPAPLSPPAAVELHSPIFAQMQENDSQAAGSRIRLPVPDTGAGNLNARDNDNRQDEKRAFAETLRKAPPPQAALPQPMITPYTLKSGSIIPGVLITGLSSDLPGMVVGQVSQPVYDTVSGTHLLIPQGSKIISEYNSTITYGQTRVQLASVSLHLPDGSTLDIGSLPIVDQSGYTGLTGDVDNHWDRIAAAIGATGALAYAGNWASRSLPDAGAAAAVSAINANANQVGAQILQKQLQIQPTITLPPGSRFNILLSRDLIIPPYKGQ
jgi:type IV secretion system protein TrbI